jgi:uncharacterized membrane protein
MRIFLFWWLVAFVVACFGGGVAAMLCYGLTLHFVGLSAAGGLAIWLVLK